MHGISLCMIVKNEEKTLARCLDSVKHIVDEIVIVDTGSTDRTKEIAKRYTENVYDFVWCEDFSKARNFSFSKATKDYIMWLDADDVILKNDREKLKKLKKKLDGKIDVAMLKYNLNIDKSGNPQLSFYRERIIKAKQKFLWTGRVHEVIEPKGNVIYEDIAITHKKLKSSDPKRNLRIYEKWIQDESLDSRHTFYYARELMYDKQYTKAIEMYNNFFESNDGWKENKISACHDLANIYVELKNKDMEITSILKSFQYDIPRAEACCNLGSYFMDKGEFNSAIYWFKEALTKKPDLTSGGFYTQDYCDFIPYMELCVAYYKLGKNAEAKLYNDLAGKIKPNDASYLKNVEYFNSIAVTKN